MRVSFTSIRASIYDHASLVTARACLPKWMISRIREVAGHDGITGVSVYDTYMFPMPECSSCGLTFDTVMNGDGILTYKKVNGPKHIRNSYTAYELQKAAIDKNNGLFNIDFGYLHRLYQPFEGYSDSAIWDMQCQSVKVDMDPMDEAAMEHVARLMHDVSGWKPPMSMYEIDGDRYNTPLNRAMNKVFFT